jgi:hypothetical protein
MCTGRTEVRAGSLPKVYGVLLAVCEAALRGGVLFNRQVVVANTEIGHINHVGHFH